MSEETKKCKYCKTEIPKDAKVGPNCRKKQSGIAKWIIIAIVIIVIIGAVAGGGDDKDKNPQKVEDQKETTQTDTKETDSSETETETEQTEEKSNIFEVGDVVETNNFRITYVSAGEYKSDNEFLQPKEGYVYWQFEFKFENISDTDQVVSSLMDWECYADNAKVDRYIFGDNNGLDATLSSGRETQGTIYYEVPADAQNVELEYDINYWQSDKIIFVGK